MRELQALGEEFSITLMGNEKNRKEMTVQKVTLKMNFNISVNTQTVHSEVVLVTLCFIYFIILFYFYYLLLCYKKP